MKRSGRIVFAALTLCLSVPSQAQQHHPRPLTLEEAIGITLTFNPAVQAAEYEEKAAAHQRRAAIGLRMPKINVAGSYAYMGKDIGFDLNGMKAPVTKLFNGAVQQGLIPQQLLPQIQELIGPITRADWFLKLQDRSLGFVGGEVSMPLYLGGKINAANRAARIDEQTAVEQGKRIRNALVSELVERYFGLALAAQAVEVRRQVVEGVQKHLDDAIAMEKNGMIARSERLYVEFKMSEAERELRNARLQLATIADALQNTLSQQNDYVPATSMFVISQLEEPDYFKELAREQNPLLKQVSLKRRLAEEGVKVQRSEFLPQVAAVGGAMFYNYQVTDALPRWAVGVGVNIKIFDGLNREYKYAAARQTVRQVDALHAKAEQDVGLLIEKLYNQMVNYRNQLVSIEASIAFAEEYLRVKNAAFLEGMSTSSDLVDAELNLAKVRIERIEAAYNFDLLLARLLEAAGISEEFTAYARRSDARPIVFDSK